MDRLEGGYLGAKPTWGTGTSPGVWTLSQALARRAAGTWPATSFLYDPYFESVSLLLHMNGSNGSTTFADSSLNSLAVTAAGNAQISTAQNRFGGASAVFDGTGDYLTLPSNTTFDLGANYTIEFWVYPNSTASNFGLVHRGFYSTSTSNWTGLAFSIRVFSGGSIRFYFYATTNANEQLINVTTTLLAANTWTHIAMVRSGTTGYAFINGVLAGTVTSLNTPAASSETLRIGRWDYSAGNEDFNGYIDDLRITKGVARYTSNFTVPDAGSDEGAALYDPYFDYVSLLLRCNGANNSTTFTDNSNNAFAITPFGDTKISTVQARFGGASAYFDGTGDYLSTPHATSLSLESGDFTLEGWIYRNTSGVIHNLVNKRVSTPASGYAWRVNASNTLQFFFTGGSSVTSTATVSVGRWTHVAVTRQGNTVRQFIDGALDATTATFSDGITNTTSVRIGIDEVASDGFNGYIDDLRITKGVCRYTTSFRPVGPYATSGKLVDPYLTSTSLLLPMTGDNGTTSFFDRSNNFLRATENGNVKVSTTQSKFGGTSAYFDGTGDYLALSNPSLYSFGAGDFTVEAWIYRVTPVLYSALLEVGNHINADSVVFIIGTGGMQLYSGAFYGSGTLSTGVWQHVAWSRSSGTLRTFVDGQLTSTTAFSNNLTSSTQASVGYAAGYNGGANYYHNGYIDDLRVTKGTARYTTAFTPPERAFNDEAFNDPHYNNVSLLLHMDGTNNSTTFTDSSVNGLTVTANGDAKISTGQSRFGGASAVFDKVDDRLTFPASPNFAFGTGDFTIEFWAYSRDVSSTGQRGFLQISTTAGGLSTSYPGSIIISQGANATGTALTGGLFVSINNVFVSSNTPVLSTDTWYHIAVTRSGGTVRVFCNGILHASATSAVDLTANNLVVGGYYNTSYLFDGYIDELRITKGIARYTSNFTVPTLPFYNTTIPTVDSSFSSVSLLLHMDGSNGSTTFTDSSSNALTVTANGNAQISTAQGRFGGASAYFDGAGDGLSIASSILFAFGTSAFTIEMYMYPTVDGAAGGTTLLDFRTISDASPWSFYIKNTGAGNLLGMYYATGAASAEWGGAGQYLALNQWHHVALVSDGITYRLFVNGTAFTVSSGSAAVVNLGATSKPCRIGISVDGTSGPYTGYIDDLRITKGVARYTSNFYIPRAAFPNA